MTRAGRMKELSAAYRSGYRAGQAEALEWIASLLDELAAVLGKDKPAAMIRILAGQLRWHAADLSETKGKAAHA